MPRKKKEEEKPEKKSKVKKIEKVEEEIENLEKTEGSKGDFKKAAEAESLKTEELERKRQELLEKAARLKEKVSIEEVSTEELKEKVKGKKKADMLVPLEDYVKSGIYLGTRVVTPNMRTFVYRRRADGLAIFNTDLIDEKLREGIQFLSKFKPEEVILVCKRQAGWRGAEMFGRLTGIRVFTKKYPAGILTNPQLPDFFENELTIIVDSWLDKNALNDTLKVNKKVLMICDTNNFVKGADEIIIGNNKSEKSLGIMFYLMAVGYCKAHKLSTLKEIPGLEWWIGEGIDVEEEAKRKARAGARFGV